MRILLQIRTFDDEEVATVHEFDFYRDIMRSSVGDIVDLAYASKADGGTALSMATIESTFEWIHGIDLARSGNDEARDTTALLEDPEKMRAAMGMVFLALRRENSKTTWADARAMPFVDITWRYDDVELQEDEAPKDEGGAEPSLT